MVFTPTVWKYSNEVEKQDIPIETGYRHLLITDAVEDEDAGTYKLSFMDLGNDAEFNITFWLNNISDNGTISPNKKARGTLISLGKALAGAPIGIPFPGDIITGVVAADVTLSPSKSNPDVSYARIYKFEPVSRDFAMLGGIDQYCIEDGEEAE